MYGLEEYYNDLLMEAKSPEEIKRILVNKFVLGRGVPEEILDAVIAVDPTKKKTYTSWVLNLWGTERPLIETSLENGNLKRLFDYYKARNNEGLNLAGIPTLYQALSMMPEVDAVLDKTGDGPENDFDIVYDSPEWKIAVPHSYEASVKLGKGCKWCTANWFGNGLDYYNRYTANGKLWINFDYSHGQTGHDNKEYKYTRYQFQFEWRNYQGEFCDYNDDRIEPYRITTMPEAVKEFYVHQNERYTHAVYGNAQSTRQETSRAQYLQQRMDDGVVLKTFSDGIRLLVLQEMNPDANELMQNANYYLYTSEDTSDPVARVPLNKDNCVIKDYERYPLIILNSIEGGDFCAIRVAHSIGAGARIRCLNYNNCEIKEETDNLKIKIKKDTYSSYSFYYADALDKLFIGVSRELNCLGHLTLVTNVFKNRKFRDGLYLECVLENNFHILFRKNMENSTYEYITCNEPIGDSFDVIHGRILGKYGDYDLNGDNYNIYKIINKNFSIVCKNGKYNIFDVNEKRVLLNTWYASLVHLKNSLIICKPEIRNSTSILISLNTKLKTLINDTRTVRDVSGKTKWVSIVLKEVVPGGVTMIVPSSLNDIKFLPTNEREMKAVKDFEGYGIDYVSENFNNLYKRIENYKK